MNVGVTVSVCMQLDFQSRLMLVFLFYLHSACFNNGSVRPVFTGGPGCVDKDWWQIQF